MRNEFNVAIVMPLGRLSPWFDRAVKSALDQSVAVKVRLIANGLTPDELIKIEDMQRSSDRLQLHVFDERLPMVQNWNRIFEVVEEKYVCALHDDDLLESWAIEELSKATSLYPGLGIYHGRERLIDEDGDFHYMEELVRGGKATQLTQHDIVGWAVSNRIWATGFLMDVSRAKDCGCYNLETTYSPDWDLYFVLAAKFGACFIESHVGRYRIGQKTGQLSVGFAKSATNLKECEIQQLKNLEVLNLSLDESRGLQKVGLAHAARATLHHFGASMDSDGKLLSKKILVEGIVFGRLNLFRRLIGVKLTSVFARLIVFLKYPVLRK